MPNIIVRPNGTVEFVYIDELRDLLLEGAPIIKRVSHVEPDGIRWMADLSPVNGPLLGPFDTREQALSAEVDYLNINVL